ncbi:ferrichrome-binding protein [Paenibacillus sp. DMB20]|nr:ferrichrome-binding protein [Paenibacillus sp. DMB20]
MLCMSVLLFACSAPSEVQQKADPANTAKSEENKEDSASATRKFTDYKGHEVDIPASPERIIFWGETYGDLLALDVDVVGTGLNWVKGFVYEDKVKNVEDLGFPINVEKVLDLKPDMIITGGMDEKEYEQLSKIAPTLMFDTFDSLENRMLLIGDLVGKKKEAEQWLAQYDASNQAMWEKLKETGMKPGETATVLTFYPGDRLFIMARTGLSQVLYQQNGFAPVDKIQELLDENTGFKEISMELLPEYAGDHIFVLTPVDEEPKKSTEEMMKSSVWRNLPAVKKGHVYTIDLLKSGSDALTRQSLLEQLPNLLIK